ncbi:HIRAN domain-containing protein [Algimonas porphyrae]|uniref:HIRAN domain-containing protein n=1 Tax=Algimonas porphyrae TaxID=1128113 RepID=A0ABQ5UZ18_9PROT|nr:HIRAN domain-containing protein [Algimonas porphyrae]GLQ20005.1 hypothetical protein GCM10007854_09600 [Algimonas porphyrae]
MSLFSKLFGNSKTEKPSALSKTSKMGFLDTGIKSYNYDVVGESNYQLALKDIAGGYRRESQYIECEAEIHLEPDNPYDPNAVKVVIENEVVGYIPAKDATRVGNSLRDFGLTGAYVDGQIRGGWKTNDSDVGHFGVKLKLPKVGRLNF